MQFEVPQFIDIEDKIFGPLTWRQFVYLGGGVGFGVVLFFVAPFIIFVLFGLPIALLAGALAFFPVNNRPFSYFLEAIFTYVQGKRLYVWKRQHDYTYKETFSPKTGQSRDQSMAAPTTPNKASISNLARKLELDSLSQ